MSAMDDVDAPTHARRLAIMGSGLFASGEGLDDATVEACGHLAHALVEQRAVAEDEPAFALSRVAVAVEDADAVDECLALVSDGRGWGDVAPSALFAAMVALDAARVSSDPDLDARLPEVAALHAMLPARESAPSFAGP